WPELVDSGVAFRYLRESESEYLTLIGTGPSRRPSVIHVELVSFYRSAVAEAPEVIKRVDDYRRQVRVLSDGDIEIFGSRYMAWDCDERCSSLGRHPLHFL